MFQCFSFLMHYYYCQNEFVGAATNYWECSQNWMTSDGSSVEHAPCAAENAIFDKV